MKENKRYSCGTDDITFCMSSINKRKNNIKYLKNIKNILHPNITQSNTEFKDAEYCPKKKKKIKK